MLYYLLSTYMHTKLFICFRSTAFNQGIESGTVITTALEMEKFLWDSSETAIHF